MAGSIIRYKLPGDRRRRGRRLERRVNSDSAESWQPPAIRPDDRPDAPRAPRTRTGTALLAALAMGLGLFFAFPIWVLIPGATWELVMAASAVGAGVTFALVKLYRPAAPLGVVASEDSVDPRAGNSELVKRSLQSLAMLLVAVAFLASNGVVATLFGLVLAIAAVGWLAHGWRGIRRFREIGEDADAAVDPAELVD